MTDGNTSSGFAACWSIKQNLRSLLSRDQSSFQVLDGLRFFSFIWILLFHTLYIYGLMHGVDTIFQVTDSAPFYLWWMWNADKAVDLFFVISGFLISVILLKELERDGTILVRRFYFRRYMRLTPLYLVFLALYWLANGPNREYVWTNLLYVNNFLPLDKMALQWTWSLAVEEQFYLLLPLFFVLVYKISGQPFLRFLLGLLVISFLIRLGVLYYYDELWTSGYRDMLAHPETAKVFYPKMYDNLATRFGPFICGALAAYGYCHHRAALVDWLSCSPLRSVGINMVAVVALVFFACFPILNSSFEQSGPLLHAYIVLNHSVFSAGLAWLMLSAILHRDNRGFIAAFLSWRIWQPLSQLTYSMYLIHFLVVLSIIKSVELNLEILAGMSGPTLLWTTIALTASISLLLCIIFGIVSWVLVEKPFLNMRKLFSVNRGSASAAPIPNN